MNRTRKPRPNPAQAQLHTMNKIRSDFKVKEKLIDSDLPPFMLAFERQIFGNQKIRHETLFCLFSRATMEG